MKVNPHLQAAMPIRSARATVAQAAPRFSGSLMSSGMERCFANLSEPLFKLPEYVEHVLDKAPGLIRQPAQCLKRFFKTTNFFEQDFSHVPFLPTIGRVGAEIPMGVMMVLAYGFMVGGRVTHALKRAYNGDKREVRDILFRDIPTISILTLGFPYIQRGLSRLLQKWKGIELMNGSSPFKYSELDNIYRVLDPNRLVTLLKNPLNHRGMQRAVDKALLSPELTVGSRSLLHQLRSWLDKGMGISKMSPAEVAKRMPRVAEKAFGVIQRLDAHRTEYLKALESGGKVAGSGIIGRFTKSFQKKLPPFFDMFTNYAKNARVWGDAFTFAIAIGILGYGITWFNQWYTEREFQKLKAQREHQATAFPNAYSQPSTRGFAQ